jgi:hypothetical protein
MTSTPPPLGRDPKRTVALTVAFSLDPRALRAPAGF